MRPKVAFYAPMKPPDSARPSGDLRIAQLFIKALDSAGFDVEVASTLRSWEGQGNAARQQKIKVEAQQFAAKIVAEYWAREACDRPQYWFTYHLYHKAPDWLGSHVSKELGIPYIIAECSIANKQKHGPWRMGWESSVHSISRADSVITLNPADAEGLASVLPDSKVCYMPPFLQEPAPSLLARKDIAEKLGLDCAKTWLISVGMMRKGDKFSSYEVLSEALKGVDDDGWQIVLIGEGTERFATEQLFAPLAERVFFAGQLSSTEIQQWLPCFDLFVWPAVNEAIGMAMLEALACGVPVLCGSNPGLNVLGSNNFGLVVLADNTAEGFSQGLQELLQTREELAVMGKAGCKIMQERCSIEGAGIYLKELLEGLK